MGSCNVQDKFFKKMSAQQKLEAAMSLYYSAKELKSAWLRQVHTEWSEFFNQEQYNPAGDYV